MARKPEARHKIPNSKSLRPPVAHPDHKYKSFTLGPGDFEVFSVGLRLFGHRDRSGDTAGGCGGRQTPTKPPASPPRPLAPGQRPALGLCSVPPRRGRRPRGSTDSGVRRYQDTATKWLKNWSTGLIFDPTCTVRQTPHRSRGVSLPSLAEKKAQHRPLPDLPDSRTSP